jgi:hypothetical protein
VGFFFIKNWSKFMIKFTVSKVKVSKKGVFIMHLYIIKFQSPKALA